jgi:hypothetical protein
LIGFRELNSKLGEEGTFPFAAVQDERIRICEIGRRDLIVPLFLVPQRRSDNKVAAP